ncbi:OmpH family outer membrane protein [Crocinitomicaceae bacterium]|nr:OmpH family outer membrane protein [Crocinitomicaceae bacterium]
MKKGLLLLVLVFGGINMNAQLKVASCDYNKITDSLPATKQAIADLLEMKKEADEEIKTMQEELQKKFLKYQQDEANMNQFAKENMEKDINQMQQNAMARERELQERMQLAQIKFLKPIEANVIKVVSEVAEKEKYDYVVDKKGVIFATSKYDITEQVLNILLKEDTE